MLPTAISWHFDVIIYSFSQMEASVEGDKN
jgi:hypothetical protein